MAEKSNRTRRSRKAANSKPGKPYPEFPLSPHNSGAWQKKIRGELHYFGRWGKVVKGKLEKLPGDDWWKPALEIYKAQADDLFAGRTPRAKTGELTLGFLANHFLCAKLRRLGLGENDIKEVSALPTKKWLAYLDGKVGNDSGRINPRTCAEYKETTDWLIDKFGKNRLVEDIRPDDFSGLAADLAQKYNSPAPRGNHIQRVRSLFKHALENGLIKSPVRYGSEFVKPDQTELRKHRAKNGEKMLEADELRRLLDSLAENPTLRAMILLGLNCGFGNHDCAMLPLSAVDLENGWVNFPRPKTGIARRCPLWKETVEALKQAIASRPQPRQQEAEDLVFVTTRGRRWLSRGIANPVSVATRDAMKAVGVHGKGIGFYTLRHVFRTVADGTRDQVAANAIMGHADRSMAATYRERIDDSRLQAVVEHVRAWLWPTTSPEQSSGETKRKPQRKRPLAKPTGAPQTNERPTLRIVG